MFKDSPLFWLSLNFLCIGIQGFYSMMEMACISFNKVRLHYYLTKDHKNAKYINFLIQRPYRLFGTVMLGLNVALQIGSQSARDCYRTLNINPDWAPLMQIFLVVVFAELIPITISRKFPEKVAMFGAPALYFSHYLFYPLILLIGWLTRVIYWILNIKKEYINGTLSRDEFQKALETHHDEHDFNLIATNIFSLSTTSAEDIMIPLSKLKMLPSSSKVSDLRSIISDSDNDFVPVYHQSKKNIIGIAVPKDFINKKNDESVADDLKSPWFITGRTKLIRILKEFRENQHTVALALDSSGQPQGILTLSTIFKTVFNTPNIALKKPKKLTVIARTFPGNTKLTDLRKELGISLTHYGVDTLAQLVMILLDSPAEEGATVITDNLLFEIKETTLSAIKSVAIKNLFS